MMGRPQTKILGRPFDDLTWAPVDPASIEGPQMAVLWGEPSHGPFGALLKVPAGFKSPLHTHTLDERVVQLRGRSVHWTHGQSRKDASWLEPGDYMLMPGGLAHVSANTDAVESLELIAMDGPFDFSIRNEGSQVAV